MGQEWNPLSLICPLTQIKPEQLPCQPSSLRGGQDRFQTCIQTDPLGKKISIMCLTASFSKLRSLQPHTCEEVATSSARSTELSWECHQQDNSCTAHKPWDQPKLPSSAASWGYLILPPSNLPRKRTRQFWKVGEGAEIVKRLTLSKSMCFTSKSVW